MRVVVFAMLTLISFKAMSECAPGPNTFCKIDLVSVYDGDTIKIQINNIPAVFGDKIGVRIKGIDTPEISSRDKCEKRLGLHVRDKVESQLKKSKRIDLRDCSRDKYFRLLCDVYADDVSVKQSLLGSGFAYAYNGGKKEKQNWCLRLPASLK